MSPMGGSQRLDIVVFMILLNTEDSPTVGYCGVHDLIEPMHTEDSPAAYVNGLQTVEVIVVDRPSLRSIKHY